MKVSVRSGDSLWGYSVKFGIPLQLIVDSNPNINPQALQIGDVVHIPGYQWFDHTIVPGDSLWRVAAANGLSLELLLWANPGLESSTLPAGAKLRVPRRVTWRVIGEPGNGYTYAALLSDLERLEEVYPFARQGEIGRSVMGKPLPELVVGSGDLRVHANGSIHANEWITSAALMRFANDYLLALTNSRDLAGNAVYPIYLSSRLSLVPMVNPDGVDLVVEGPPQAEPYRGEVLAINSGSTDFSGWKANIRGVDLNKQFPALWERDAVKGPQKPAPRDYSGTAPLTEPEVQALAALTRAADFGRVLAFHTQGEVIFWGFEGLEPPESAVLAADFAAASGYEPIQYVDSTAGYKDWFIQDWRRPGFTVELGIGVNPLPISQLDRVSEATSAIMIEALRPRVV